MKEFMCLLSFLLMCQYASGKGVDISKNSITLSLGTEPSSLDSTMVEGVIGSHIIDFFQEGLVRIDRGGEVQPGVAERWAIEAEEVTFWLRENSLWQDGQPVTAQDFVYAWRRLVDPATGAGGSTFFAYMIENGSDILAGKMPVESLGVVAVSDRILKVQLSQPAPYLLTVLSWSAYKPLKQTFVEAQKGRYAADAVNFLANGPFILESWVHGSSLKLVKNPDYWNAGDIDLDAIDYGYLTPDIRSRFSLYLSGELAALDSIDMTILPEVMNSGHRIGKARSNCASWILMNFNGDRMTSNYALRQAISLAIDREIYVNKIIGLPGTRKIDSVFPGGMRGVNISFQQEYPAEPITYDLVKARAALEDAKREMGLEKIPPLVLLTNERRQLQSEFIQSQLMNALGLEIRIDTQTFKQYLSKALSAQYDLIGEGYCSGSLNDPVMFAGIFASFSPWNTFGYKNLQYDKLMRLTHRSSDQAERMDAFSQMQKILYEDRVVIPTHEGSVVYVQDKQLRGVTRYPSYDYSRGRIAQ